MGLPIISTTVTQANGCTSSSCPIVIGEQFTVTPTYDLNGGTGCTNSTLLYELYDYIGTTLITSQTNTITNATPEDPSLLTFLYTPSIVGDLILKTTLTNCDGASTETKTLSASDYIRIIKTSTCHSFTLQNCSTTVDVKYTFETKAGVVIGTALTNLLHTGGVTLNTTTDGIYYIKIYNSSSVLLQQYILIDRCDIDNCLANRILDLGCGDCSTNKCVNFCELTYSLLGVMALAYRFYNKVNTEYSLNRIYTSLDSTKLTELDDMEDLITQLSTYCASCTDIPLNYSSIGKTSTGDCGCGGTE